MRAASPVFRFAVSSIAAIGCWVGLAQAQAVLDLEGTTLTSYLPTARTLRQDLRPRFDQRGVDIDGTLRSPSGQGWSLAADNLGGGYGGGRKIGDIMLAQGAYNPTDIDLALPTLGPPVIIGRTYNAVQVAGGSRSDSNGFQGFNWSNLAAPEIQFKAGTTSDLDVVYLVYGADRYIEFKRTGVGNTEFKAKNGAAGVMQIASPGGSAPDIYTYFDQRGNTSKFFGFDTNSGLAQGQLWNITDAAGQMMYVGDASSATTAISSGFNASGYISTMYDASGRRYTFTYSGSAIGGTKRLLTVVAETKTGGTWASPTGVATVGQVDYRYFDGTVDTGSGVAGDLRSVTVTLPDSVGGFYITNRYYRYYISSWSSGAPGSPHAIKLAVAPEGVRQAGGITAAAAMSDATLQAYADSSFEYVSGSDYRISKAILNGGCGCAGGSGVTYYFSYDPNSSYGTWTGNTSYDSGLAQRTIIQQPDGSYVAQYFDEAAQPRARVIATSSAFSSTWVTEIARNSSGQVTQILSPEVNSGYSHSGWSWSSTGSGMVTDYTRFTTPTNLVGLRQSVGVRPGTTGTLVTLSSVTLNERQRVVGATGVVLPYVATSSTYPSGSALTTNLTTVFWDNTTNTNAQYIAPKSIQADAPAVSSGNNGLGSATTTFRYLRADGSTAFTQDATGIFFYSGRDAFGNTSISIADVSTSSGSIASGDAASNWGITSSGSPIGATSTYTYDAQGRITQSTVPSVGGTRTQGTVYTALTDGRLQIMTSSDMSGANYLGPISVNVTNQAGRSELQGVVSLTTAGSMPSGTPSSSTWQRVTTTVYDFPGVRPLESRVYTAIPSSLPGSSGTNYDSTTYGYDSMGRREKTVDPTGTITRTVFETRGLVVATWIGTSDAGFTSSGGGNMTQVQTVEYDGGSPGKNGWATTRTQKPTSSSSDDRVTTTQYDYRGRAILQFGPVSPYSVMKYDDLSRVIAAGQYSSTSGLTTSTDPTSTASNRIGLSETVYDERGQVARTTQWQIVQGTGAKATGGAGGAPSIVTDNWYDAAGRSIKRQGSTINKTAYDRLGRSVAQWLLAKTDDAAYGDASGVTGDTVLEESRTSLAAASGRPIMQWSISRHHDESSGTTGQLDSTSTGTNPTTITAASIKGRVQISAQWYDQFDRVTASAQFGTAGIPGDGATGTNFPRPGSAPSSTSTALVTSMVYDGWGNTSKVYDPAGVQTLTIFDNAGRRTSVNNDYVDGTAGGGSNNDQDRIVEYTYSNGLVATVTRKMTSSVDDQTTTYTYGVVKTGTNPSDVVSNRLLASVLYPEQSSGQAAGDRTSSYSYNALGQTKTSADPAGNVITNTYDTAGRITARVATTVAGTFDGTVNRIETSYDVRGKMSGTLQKNSAGTVLDEVKLEYDDWGNLSIFTQDPDSAITGGSGRASYQLTYNYALNTSSGGWQSMKLTQWTQPGSVTVTPSYGTAGSIADLTGRINSMTDQTSATISTYSYLGAGTVVGLSLNEPNVVSTLYSGGSSTYSSYMDRFNRPTRQVWYRALTGGTLPVFVDRTMTYDLVGNMTSLVDTTMLNAAGVPNFDALYTYDSLRRLDAVQEGQLNGTGSAIISLSRQQNLARNLAGRVTNDQLDLNGNSAYTDGPPNATAFGEMNDTRTYNKRNELTSRSVLDSSNPSTPRTVTLTYDLNGNMTSDGERYKYTYNPWCQVVQVKTQANVVVGNIRYNGLGMRISEQFDTNNAGNGGVGDGKVDSSDPTFFIVNDMQGRRVGTFRGTDTNPKETFVQHPGSVRGLAFRGGIILRDRDSVSGSALSDPTNWAKVAAGSARGERNYPATDLRGSTVALVDAAGKLVEQFRYSPTGVPLGIPLGDVTGDGYVDGTKGAGTDYTIVDGLKSPAAYSVRADLNLDGVVNASDVAIVTAQAGTKTGRGKLSRDSVAWRSGWGGMEWQGTLGTYGDVGMIYDAVIGIDVTAKTACAAPPIPFGVLDPSFLYPMFRPLLRTPAAIACWEWYVADLAQVGFTWIATLPDCPCFLLFSIGPTPPAGTPLAPPPAGVWKAPSTGPFRYHPGCVYEMRSNPVGWSGQQCCYDAAGSLITGGRGAGTPDYYAPDGVLSTPSHLFRDVIPFDLCNEAGLLPLYWSRRPPNQGPALAPCTKNII